MGEGSPRLGEQGEVRRRDLDGCGGLSPGGSEGRRGDWLEMVRRLDGRSQ